jgi:hypothetical protein
MLDRAFNYFLVEIEVVVIVRLIDYLVSIEIFRVDCLGGFDR